MFSSAKHGSHGFVRSLDSSYPSLMASAVGADRFWQIDLGVIESINNERRAVRHWQTALFVFDSKLDFPDSNLERLPVTPPGKQKSNISLTLERS